jgi:hypothetical protein
MCICLSVFNLSIILLILEYAVAQLDEVLRYKPEGRGFDFRLAHWESTQSLTEMSTRDISWGVKAAGT